MTLSSLSAPSSPLTRRIIPCLDVKDGQVVKGVRFRGHEVIGDPVVLARRYAQAGADELVFYDITASSDGRTVGKEWVSDIARVIDIPFCVAGGIRTPEQARAVLSRGADKISINSPALQRPDLIEELVAEFGQQCVVIGIDSFQDDAGRYRVYQFTGEETRTRQTGWDTLEWAQEVVWRGAGEIVLNCMNRDGVRQGYDVAQLRAVREVCPVPLIASGGAGAPEHFTAAFQQAGVDGALAASVFHKGLIEIADLKAELARQGVSVRPVPAAAS
ncbi:imidazole glycerol phosphate synthase subunit HisF [Deinococcus sp. Marseille-Q6407]|uniref:imidazole glycerol phosphate synthase subunit HisF n=1 Tax=Deinococcus sp. Marseille-Q6407 TaxID=2969223 RepID=UPI0021BE298C|nr:imidazole glycerol phosphate synthase subunit HisF [Deinococcus sp. Marseille-Q6407]